jgi:hypothetical protein
MSTPKVTLTFKNGKVEEKTEGFKGGRCIEASKFVQEILKPTDQNVEYTDEYYAKPDEEDGLLA